MSFQCNITVERSDDFDIKGLCKLYFQFHKLLEGDSSMCLK